jgi:hypothetical protein
MYPYYHAKMSINILTSSSISASNLSKERHKAICENISKSSLFVLVKQFSVIKKKRKKLLRIPEESLSSGKDSLIQLKPQSLSFLAFLRSIFI